MDSQRKDELGDARSELRQVRLLATEAWELAAMALVAIGNPREDLLRSVVEKLAIVSGRRPLPADVTELERLRSENAELRQTIRQFSAAAMSS